MLKSHANALMYLISNGVFNGKAKENAIVAKDKIQERHIATAEKASQKQFC